MMQLLLARFFFAGVLLVVGTTVRADEFNLPNPGLTPESPFYFLDIWDEKVRLFFTYADSERYKRHAGYMQERLAETNKLAGRGVAATQKSLELYRADVPQVYATAERLGDNQLIADALRMATVHLEILDSVSERTDFEKKNFVRTTKMFIINQQLQTLSVFAEDNTKDALHIFGDALGRRMDRLRAVAIDKENQAEALDEYISYLTETSRIRRDWLARAVGGVLFGDFLEITLRGHEEILLGHVRERLSPALDEQLLLAVNGVRAVYDDPPFAVLPEAGAEEPPLQNGFISPGIGFPVEFSTSTASSAPSL